MTLSEIQRTCMINIILSVLAFLFLQGISFVESRAMEKEAPKAESKIILPSAPAEQILATFKETEVPRRVPVDGTVKLISDDGKIETVPLLAIELSKNLWDLIQTGADQPLPIPLTGSSFSIFVESLQAINSITSTDPKNYSETLVITLIPILGQLDFKRLLDLLCMCNKLNIKPLTWYISALFATALHKNNDLSVQAHLIESLTQLTDIPNLIAKMIKTAFREETATLRFFIPIKYSKLALKGVAGKGIMALTNVKKDLYLWNLTKSSNAIQKTLGELDENTQLLIISDDGNKALSLLHNDTIQIWDLVDGKLFRQLKSPHFKRTTALSHDGKYVLANSLDGVDLWDLENDTVKPIVKMSGISFLEFSPDGNYALIGLSDNTIQYLNINMPETIKLLVGHTALLSAAGFSLDGKYVLTGSFDKTAILWDLTQASKELKPFKILKNHTIAVTGVAISPDNNYALTGSWETTFFWDLKSCRPLKAHTILGSNVSSVAFTANGKYALVGAQTVVLSPLSDRYTLKEIVLFMKHNQLESDVLMKDSYFKRLYDELLEYA